MQISSISSANFNGIEKANRTDLVQVGINGAGSGIGKNTLTQYLLAHHTPKNVYHKWDELQKIYGEQNLVIANLGSMKMKAEKGETLYDSVKPEDLLAQLQSNNVIAPLPDSIKLDITKENGNTYLDVHSRYGEDERIKLVATRNKVNWSEYNTQVVVDTTGANTTIDKMGVHLGGSVKRAILSAPAKDDMVTIIPGINSSPAKLEEIAQKGGVVSAASCTTTCASPFVKLFDEAYGINSGYLDTTHAATNSQNITDQMNKEADSKNRGSFDAMIPTTTGAAKALKLVTNVGSTIGGSATRVPTAEVSMVTLILNVKDDKVTKEGVLALLDEATRSRGYRNLITKAPKGSTSRDMHGRIESGAYIPESVQVITGKDGAKTIALKMYYDNEFGYTRSLGTLTTMVGKNI